MACSASIYAQIPPFFCASATIWSERVVLPEDSGPNISMILPRGIPPTPRAISSPMDPVGMTLISTLGESPNFIIDPSPNLVWMALRVFSRLEADSSFLSFFSFFIILHFNTLFDNFFHLHTQICLLPIRLLYYIPKEAPMSRSSFRLGLSIFLFRLKLSFSRFLPCRLFLRYSILRPLRELYRHLLFLLQR